MDKLYEVKDKLIDEIEKYADKGKLSKDDAMALKALTGSVDHLCNIIEGEEGYSETGSYDGMNGNSNRSYRGSYRGNSNRGSYRGSYARGRVNNARRDSMGRYSSDGYSRHGLSDKLYELMEDAPDEHTRMEIQKLAEKMG